MPGNKSMSTYILSHSLLTCAAPSQVRNLRPATKVAVDFVAPDSMPVAFRLRQVYGFHICMPSAAR